MTSTPYTIGTREDAQGVDRPDDILWTPTAEDAIDRGFIQHDGLYLCGIGQEEELPDEFIALGHNHTWSAMCQAAAAYLKQRAFEPDTTGRRPLPERRHAVFLQHPHPDHPCSCEWDGSWRIVYVPDGTPGAIAVTVMQRGGER